MSNPSCCHVTLARNGVGHVQQCTECNCISLHLGPTTVRIDQHCLESLLVLLGEAVTELHVQRASVAVTRGLA